MPNLIAAALAALLALLGFLPTDVGPSWLAPIRQGVLIFLTLYLAAQAFATWRKRDEAPTAPTGPTGPATPATPATSASAGADALILLSLLQERGRFLDFVSEDISAYTDVQVAAASRVVHQGCKAVINECLALAPAHAGAEGDAISVDPAADPNRYRLQGKLGGQPPYRGVVVHRGWKATRFALPRHTRPVDPAGENIVAPIDVEVR